MTRITAFLFAAVALTLLTGCASQPTPEPTGHPHHVTPIHPLLQELVGEWDVRMRVWMTPDAEPADLHSVAYRERHFGDLFVTEETVWDIPTMGRRNFLFYWGISGMSGRVQKVSMGEGNTELSHMTGDWDQATRTITMYPTGAEAKMRTVVTLSAAPDRREVHETFVPGPDGKEFLQWQFTYTPRRIPAFDQQKAVAYGTPSENHQRLAGMIGRWNATMTMHPEEMPEPMVMRGTSNCVWLVEGLFVQETVRWEMPGMGGFDMHYIHGFHNGTGQYQVMLLSSMSSGIEVYNGTADPETGVVTLEGRTWEAHLGEMIPLRAVIQPHAEKRRSGELWLRYGGTWKRAGVIEYTRE